MMRTRTRFSVILSVLLQRKQFRLLAVPLVLGGLASAPGSAMASTLFTETFNTDTPDVTDGSYPAFTLNAGTASVSGGVLELDGGTDLRQNFTIRPGFSGDLTITGKVKAATFGTFNVGMEFGKRRFVFHPGFSGNPIGAFRIDGQVPNQNMGFIPSVSVFHTMELDWNSSLNQVKITIMDGEGIAAPFVFIWTPDAGFDPTGDIGFTSKSGGPAFFDDLTVSSTSSVCGNGDVETDEECDDGNTLDGDCCSATCQNEPAGSQTCGVGACEVATDVCADGVPVDCTPGAPTTEICDGLDNDCDGIVDNAAIEVFAAKHIVGSGSHPGSSKEPIVGINACAYEKSVGSCAHNYGVSWQNYADIVLGDGTSPPCEPVNCATTDLNGVAVVNLPPGDYIVITHFDSDGDGYFDQFLGVSASDLLCGELKKKHLQLLQDADGKKKPGKTTRLTGSELLIIEPEYVLWDETEQLYPFVFETIGEWGITTSVAPPEGFVADYAELSEYVDNALAAVQFTITEVGSDLVPTETTFEVTHNGRSRTVRSRVGIALTPDYAQSRGFNVAALRAQGLIKERPDNHGQGHGQ